MLASKEENYDIPFNTYKDTSIFNGINKGKVFHSYYWDEKNHEYVYLSIDKYNIINYIVKLKYYTDGLVLPKYDFGPNPLYESLNDMWTDFVENESIECVKNPKRFEDINKFLNQMKKRLMIPQYVFDAFSSKIDISKDDDKIVKIIINRLEKKVDEFKKNYIYDNQK